MKFLFAASILALISGCGAFDTKEKGSKADENDQTLTGVWHSDCVANSRLDLSHAKYRVAFSAVGDFDKTESMFGGEGCTAEKLNVRLIGTYAEVGDAAVGNEVNNINFTVKQVSVSIVDADYVDVANGLKICGKEDWVKDTAIDVTGVSCAGSTLNSGDVLFDVYKVDSEAWFGHQSLFMSEDDADARPDNIDTSITFHKK